MPGVSRTGVDTAGGTILATYSNRTYVGGSMVAVVGDAIASHGTSPHSTATMTQGSSRLSANGRAVCFAGCSASCGHTATGSSRTFAS